jgi:hypothetical protein
VVFSLRLIRPMAESGRSRPPEAGQPAAEEPLGFLEITGEVPEWFIGAVSKTVVP